MMSSEKTDPIGKEILSIAFGVGVISGIEKVRDGGDDFYVVEYGDKKNVKNYLPIQEGKKSRFLSEEDDFLDNLNRIKSKKMIKKFQSKNERQIYFSSVLADCTLDQMVDRVHEMNSIKDLTPIEKTKLKKLKEVLEAEASALYKLGPIKSKEFIAEFLAE